MATFGVKNETAVVTTASRAFRGCPVDPGTSSRKVTVVKRRRSTLFDVRALEASRTDLKMVVGAVLFDDLLIHGYPDFLGLSCLFTCTSSLDHELSYIFHIKFSACRIICFKYLRKTVVLQTKFVLNNQIINEKKHGCLYPQTFLILPHWISNIYNFLTT